MEEQCYRKLRDLANQIRNFKHHEGPEKSYKTIFIRILGEKPMFFVTNVQFRCTTQNIFPDYIGTEVIICRADEEFIRHVSISD